MKIPSISEHFLLNHIEITTSVIALSEKKKRVVQKRLDMCEHRSMKTFHEPWNFLHRVEVKKHCDWLFSRWHHSYSWICSSSVCVCVGVCVYARGWQRARIWERGKHSAQKCKWLRGWFCYIQASSQESRGCLQIFPCCDGLVFQAALSDIQ